MKHLSHVLFMMLVIASLVLAGCTAPATQAPAAAPTDAPAAEPPAEVDNTITVATDATFPPFETINETSQEMEGFDIDLIKAVAEEANLEIEFINVGFDPLLAGIAQCQYDVAIAAITITDERKESLLFSEPYINAGQIVSVQKDNEDIKGPEDLKGKTIGAQIGTTGAIEAGNIEGATVNTYDSYDLAFLDLANGQIDAVIADYPTALGFVGQNLEQLKTVGEVFTDENYGIAVCKDNQALLDKLNAGLAAVKGKGLIDQFAQKWLAGQ